VIPRKRGKLLVRQIGRSDVNEFDQLLRQHQELQGRVTRDPAGINLAEVEELLVATRAAGKHVAAVERRDHLRAILRNWGAFVYERTGEYPATQLEPYGGQSVGSAEREVVSATIFPPSPPSTEEREQISLEAMPAAGQRERSSYLTNPLVWIALAIVAIVLVMLAMLTVLRNETPATTVEPTTGIPPDVAGPIIEDGETVIDVTRMPEDDPSGVDFVLTIRPEATIQDLAAALQTNVETLQALNPTLSSLPLNDTLFSIIGQPVKDAQLVVTSPNATLFNRPNRQAGSITNLQSGSFAPVLGRTTDYDWYWVNTRQGLGWLTDQDTGLIYPTVPDSLPIIARILVVPDTVAENDNDD
jgi:hypothetical protein